MGYSQIFIVIMHQFFGGGEARSPPYPPHALVCQFWKFIWKILLDNKSPSSSPKYGKSYLLNGGRLKNSSSFLAI
jgi:hypothetical protein